MADGDAGGDGGFGPELAAIPPALLHATPIGLLRTDDALRIRTANAAMCAMAGVPDGALAGRPLADLAPPGRAAELVGRLRAAAQPVVAEWAIPRPDGTALRARASLALDPTGIVALFEELSGQEVDAPSLREALRLTAVAERAARLGGYEMDVGRRRLTWTHGTRRIHEVAEDFSPTPREALSFVVPEARDAVNAAFIACAAGGPHFDLEAEIVTARGRRRWVQITGEAQRDAAGRVLTVAGTFQDVSDIMAAKAANRRLSERLAATIESITDACFTLDAEQRFTYVNQRAVELLGRPCTALLGHPARDCPLLDPAGPVGRALGRALEERAPVAEEVQVPESGAWLDLRAYPATDGLTVVLHDITARRKEAERLRLLEACVARLNDILLITEAEPIDEPGPRIVLVNDAFRRITGYAPEEVIGRTPRILQGPGTQRAELDRIGAALRAWQPVRAELLNYTKSGEELWLDLAIVPVADERGWYTHWVAIERDVTERKRAQTELEQQAALLDQVGDAIVVRDMAERILFWNGAAERIYGWRAEEVLGRGVRDLVYEDAAAIDEPMRILLRDGQWSGRFGQRRRDGAPVVVEARWRLMRNPDGTPRAVLAVSTDVTEQVRLEERLRRSQRLEAVGQLTGGIAHDFNNLLTVILGNAEMLAEALPGDDELRGLAEMTVGAAERGAELTARLLAFARRQALDPKLVRVDLLLSGLVPLLRRAAGEQVELRMLSAPDLWSALIDPVQLETAMLNLCVNARDAMPSGGVLTVSAANVQLGREDALMEGEVSPGDYVTIAVGDTGAGMAPDVAARVFEPFFTTKEVGKGSGLGLSMVYGFIKQSGGHVRIHTAPGRGTTVRLFLPRGASGGAAPAEGQRRAELPGGTETVLLVEDQPMLREHAAAQLRELGYRVLPAGDAAAALAELGRAPEVALLLTDIALPGGMDGLALAAAAAAERPGLRVLLASGLAENEGAREGVAASGLPVLAKPYRRRDLALMVRSVLDAPR
jgi:PAS domain S-box-containing protein